MQNLWKVTNSAADNEPKKKPTSVRKKKSTNQ